MLNNEQLKKLSEALKESANNTESVLIIDGVNTFLRAYATGMSQTTQGTNTGAISGFFSSIGYALKKINPSLCIIIFDGEKGSTRRRKLFSEYKNNRRPVTRRKIFEEEEVDSRKETY